jgi:hypothetical protein
VLVCPLPVYASLCPVAVAPAKLLQCAYRPVSEQDNVPPFATITTVRSTSGHKLLAAEADYAIATVSTFSDDLYTINHYLLIIWTVK